MWGCVSVTSYDVAMLRVFHAIACETARLVCNFTQIRDIERNRCNPLQ